MEHNSYFYLLLLLLVIFQLYPVQAKQTSESPGGRRRRGGRCDAQTANLLQGELRTLSETHEVLRGEVEDLQASMTLIMTSVASLTSVMAAILPEDCTAAYMRGARADVVKIRPPGLSPRDARCTYGADTDNYGWTVVLSRYPHYIHPATAPGQDPTVAVQTPHQHRRSFNRTWEEYKKGFGELDGEFWIGNEVLHSLTQRVPHQLRVVLTNWEGISLSATWDKFSIGSEEDHYRLSVSHYRTDSTAKDNLSYHNDKYFSTHDKENDPYDHDHCAQKYGGGWWYNSCYEAHLTGVAGSAGTRHHQGIIWHSWGRYQGLKAATMMIRPPPRPVPCS